MFGDTQNLNRDCSQKVYSKAAKAELERDYDRAFQLYLKAADGFLHLDSTTSDTSIRAACKTEAGKALDRAEKIKAIKRDLTPVLVDPLSPRTCFAMLFVSMC